MIHLTATTAGHSYHVTFTGDEADRHAAAFIERKPGTRFAETAVEDLTVPPVPESAVRTLAILYPEAELLEDYPPSDWYNDDVDYDRIANAYERERGW